MWVRDLHLTDFRSYPTASVRFEPGITTILGRNGRGKTNLIEAIGYVATLHSHRVANDAPLVRAECDHALINLSVVDDQRTTTIDVLINPGRANKARINGVGAPRARDVLGIVRTVLFAPEDLAIVKGDPGERRKFLDDVLIQQRPMIAGVRHDYERVLKQRNALLKSARSVRDAQMSTLESWDIQLADLGAQVISARIHLLDELRQPFAQHYARIADEARATVEYRSALGGELSGIGDSVDEWREAMLTTIENRRREEIDRGVTLVGPQRDDVLIGLGDHPAKGYASHGESWSLALALRLASFDVLRQDADEPVLILDDVFAELDTKRREHLAEAVTTMQQVIITAAVEADIPAQLRGNRLQVEGNQVIAA